MRDASGMITVAGSRSFHDTVERVCAGVTSAGYHVFARVDHAGNAVEAGMDLPPTVLVLFGKPDVGTELMQDRRTAGVDLPSKFLVWEDERGAVRMRYNSARWLADRHGLGEAGTAAARTLGLVAERICEQAA
ncbi:DUF302 domain-containing protein [Streptomyces sp. NPDC052492]|uniref:DUF302 domain-containing protein n=1 Tax=Streptomyces sp. NPDC052492 TaxID=3365691 RepID=UPI0037D140F8